MYIKRLPDNIVVVVEADSTIMMRYHKMCVFGLLCLISISTSLPAPQSELEASEPGLFTDIPQVGPEASNEENLNGKKEEPLDLSEPPKLPELELESSDTPVTVEDESAKLEEEKGVSSEGGKENEQKDNEKEPGEENEEAGEESKEIGEEKEEANQEAGKEKEETGENMKESGEEKEEANEEASKEKEEAGEESGEEKGETSEEKANTGDQPDSQKPVEVILEVNKPSPSFFGSIFTWPPSFPSFQFPSFSWPSFFGRGQDLLIVDPYYFPNNVPKFSHK